MSAHDESTQEIEGSNEPGSVELDEIQVAEDNVVVVDDDDIHVIDQRSRTWTTLLYKMQKQRRFRHGKWANIPRPYLLNVEWSIRAMVALLSASIVVFVTRDILLNELVVVFSSFLVAGQMGLSMLRLSSFVSVVIGVVIGAAISSTYAATNSFLGGLLIFLFSWFMEIPKWKDVLAARLGLALGVIVVLLHTVIPNTWELAVKLIFTLLAAYGCGLLAAILPYPRFATRDVDRHIDFIRSCVSRRFHALIGDFAVEEGRSPDRSPQLRMMAEKRLIEARQSLLAVQMEHPFTTLEPIVKELDTLKSHMKGLNAMETAMENFTECEYLTEMRSRIGVHLIDIGRWIHLLMFDDYEHHTEAECRRGLQTAMQAAEAVFVEMQEGSKAAPHAHSVKQFGAVFFFLQRMWDVILPLSEPHPTAVKTMTCQPFLSVFKVWQPFILWDRSRHPTFKLFVRQELIPRLLNSFLMAVAVLVAALLILIPALAQTFYKGVWGALTVILIWSPGSGRSFATGKSQLIGTIVGAMYTYLVLHIVNLSDSVGITIFGMIWIFFVGQFREQHGESTTVAIMTSLIILYGQDSPHVSAEQFIFARIVQVALATSIVVIVNAISWIMNSTRKRLRATFDTVCKIVGNVTLVASRRCSLRDEDREIALQSKQIHMGELLAAIERPLFDELGQEPQLWRVNIPTLRQYVLEQYKSHDRFLLYATWLDAATMKLCNLDGPGQLDEVRVLLQPIQDKIIQVGVLINEVLNECGGNIKIMAPKFDYSRIARLRDLRHDIEAYVPTLFVEGHETCLGITDHNSIRAYLVGVVFCLRLTVRETRFMWRKTIEFVHQYRTLALGGRFSLGEQ